MDEHIELVRSIYAGFAAKNVDAALAACADDVTIDQDPSLPWGGHYVGRDGVVEFLVKLTTDLDTTVEIEQLFRAGDDVVQVGRSVGTVRSTGQIIDGPECHIWTIRNGTIHAARFYIDSAKVLPALENAAAN